MIIVLRPNCTQPEIDHVLERIKELGLKPHLSQGEHRTIIGVIGDESEVADRNRCRPSRASNR